MKLGIIGSGMIVKEFLSIAAQLHNLKVTAICGTERSLDKLNRFAADYEIDKVYINEQNFFEDADIDTVYIAVPNHLHYEFIIKALEAKKHVICEKPFVSIKQEAYNVRELAIRNNRIVLEAVTTLFLPNTTEIKKRLTQIGTMKIIVANYSQYSSRYDEFKKGIVLPVFDPKKSGGALMDLNIYNLHLMVYLFGKPINIKYAANIEQGIDTSGILTLDYGSFKCVCIGAKDCKAPLSTVFQGDEGSISIDSATNVINGFKVLMNDTSLDKVVDKLDGVFEDYNNGEHKMVHEFRTMIEIIENNRTLEASKLLEHSVIVTELQNKARQSAGIIFEADKKYLEEEK